MSSGLPHALAEAGHFAALVLIGLMVAVALAVFVWDVWDGLKKKERDQ